MIYTIGESVLDIIIQDFDNVKIRPGGSMLNTAISLGRLGINVSHVSYLSNDITSIKLIDFLKKNNVGTDFLLQKANQTNLALAYLNKENNASYTFYKEDNKTRIQLSFPKINSGDFILFGSFFSLNIAYRESLFAFLNYAKQNGAILMYDPNFRKPHLTANSNYTELVEENLRLAHIVKASDEDFLNIFNIIEGNDAYNELLKYNIQVLLYTRGSKESIAYYSGNKVLCKPPRITAISTIGAGDTFSAGVLYCLNKTNQAIGNANNFENANWKYILKTANGFAAHVCTSFDNYLSTNFIKDLKNV